MVKYHRLILFIGLEIAALSWYVRSHAHPHGKWIQWSLAWNGAWQEQFAQWERWEILQEQNNDLLAVNVRLRNELLDHSGEGTVTSGAEVIHGTTDLSSNLFVLKVHEPTGALAGQGVLSGGRAAGRIVEVSGDYALMLPLVHTSMEWSARLGRTGEIGRVVWKGTHLNRGTMLDLPRSARPIIGDTVFTSGFAGVFPADISMGYVIDLGSETSEEFKSVEIEWAVNFHRFRHVELVQFPGHTLVDSLHQLIYSPAR